MPGIVGNGQSSKNLIFKRERGMLNFRKLKQDYSPAILKEGRVLYEKKKVFTAKIIKLNPKSVRISCRVQGGFDNTYECEVEFDRRESITLDSDCDCPYKFDCQHLSAVLFYLEEHFDRLLVEFSREADLEKEENYDDSEKASLLEVFKEAETKEVVRKGKKCQKELMQEYVGAAHVLGTSPFFIPEAKLSEDKAELNIIYTAIIQTGAVDPHHYEIQLALRLPYRSKPLSIPNIKEFIDALRYQEPLYIGTKRYYFVLSSFDHDSAHLLKMIMDFALCLESKEEKCLRTAQLDPESFGTILADAFDLACAREAVSTRSSNQDLEPQTLPCLYGGSQEDPLRFSKVNAAMRFSLEYLNASAPKILLQPSLILDLTRIVSLEEVLLFECAKPGMIKDHVYYRFQPRIKRKHLRNLATLREITIPEPLFGTFIENSLPEFLRYAEVANRDIIERFVTLPFTGALLAECDIHYLNGELEAVLHFIYDKIKVPAALSQIKVNQITPFVTRQGVLARNLTEEQNIIADLFQGFIYDSAQGIYSAKSEKKIVEFMTEVIPRNQNKVKFNCPENLLDQFIYDETTFDLTLSESDRVDMYEVDLKVHGHLNGVTVDLLWDCLAAKRAYIEILSKKQTKKKEEGNSVHRPHKILVLDLERLAPVVQIFDEIGINRLDDHKELRPLWSLVSISAEQFQKLPIKFTMTPKLFEIQEQMLGNIPITPSCIPGSIHANLRSYQHEGIGWLERLRRMHLNGILADDMGLGKTLQAITAITQYKEKHPNQLSIVISPTSLVYNWKEEFTKFNSSLKVLAVDGTPNQRKKLQTDIKNNDIIITSYSLLQKDIEFYKTIPFGYAVLDEAQHIKNRTTRNAKSVKMIQAAHRLILTGTPIENSLDELWSLFDFLMPGLLSTYDRFLEKYVRNVTQNNSKNMEALRRKVSPFILRRMKKDVLSELPPVTEIIYHCHLSDVQKQLYHSYVVSAREELSQLVKKEGFERVQIHVLATLTRLKQICCHPAIFAKDSVEPGDSSKYDMLLELLQNLMDGQHKTVIFSQYTRMLGIIRNDLQKMGIRFEYLDGTTKNRLAVVNKFNEDDKIPIFLVSLKAGGTGLNITSANAVVHYDMWWNPAVEDQATDRVHRLGQKRSVSAYKLITLDSIEEKILQLQQRKKGYVKKVVSCDEEAMSKLTWEEVLELLQT
jgi:SNF2 family DNA or RNA helicase